MSSKRPRGLWRSQRSHGKVPEAIVTDLDIEDVTDPQELTPVPKKPRLSYSEKPASLQRSKADVEEWEDVKELFAHAVDQYEAESPAEAAELFRRVIHESDRLLRIYPDPLTLLSTGQDVVFGSAIRCITTSSQDPIRATDPPTTFHYVYGTSMFLLGKTLEAYPTLAKEVEPVGTPAFYLAALDVLEDGENASHLVHNHRFLKEDWRLALSIGRILVCLADEKLRRLSSDHSSRISSVPIINFQDDLWPKDSAFGPSFTRRPPMTRRITLPSMTPHEIIVQATDYFSRAMLHMPHPKAHRNQSKLDPQDHVMDEDLSDSVVDPMAAPPTMPGLATASRTHLLHLRPRVLFTLSNEVLAIADRIPNPSERECWAKWADDVFMQMEIDEIGEENWTYPVAIGRGRCWLIIGSTRFEAIEKGLERGDHVLTSAEAENARGALLKAVKYLEKAQVNHSTSCLELQDPFAANVSPMLGEAFVTLATLTEGPKKEEFFARAAAEGVDVDDEEEQLMEDDR